MKKFAVVLSGCGVYDGAEIHESVLTLLAIDRAGALYQCFAPDIWQHHVMNHVTGKEMPDKRNVLAESARIARGSIKSLSLLRVEEFDALIFPGGFGAAKNLCDWAIKGDHCTVNHDVEKSVKGMFAAGKPIGAMCIAPVILAKLFSGSNFTTGNDPSSGAFIRNMGNEYTPAKHGVVVEDKARKLFTTPCYMLDATISDVAEGTENLVNRMLSAMV